MQPNAEGVQVLDYLPYLECHPDPIPIEKVKYIHKTD